MPTGPQKPIVTNNSTIAPTTTTTSSSNSAGVSKSSATGSGPSSMLTVELAAAAAAAAVALQQQQHSGSDMSGSPAAELSPADTVPGAHLQQQQKQEDHNGRFVVASYYNSAGQLKPNRKLHVQSPSL